MKHRFGLALAAALALGLCAPAVAGPAEDAFLAHDYAKAAELWRVSAEAGSAIAQTDLAQLYYEGKGVQQDYAEAARWFQKAADLGRAQAQSNLAMMYFAGQGVTRDPTIAVSLLQRAAAQNFLPAMVRLGQAYRDGSGVAADAAIAARWFRAAADQSDSSGLFELGNMYRQGLGTGMDLGKAVACYRLAADTGYGPAQFNMGVVYYSGQGADKDFALAYHWFSLAEKTWLSGPQKGPDQAAAALKILVPQMAPGVAEKAQPGIDAWRPKYPLVSGGATALLSVGPTAPRPPEWSVLVKQAGLTTSRVDLACTSTIEGGLRDCRVISNVPPVAGLGDQAVQKMAPNMKFSPASKDCVPVEAPARIGIVFRP